MANALPYNITCCTACLDTAEEDTTTTPTTPSTDCEEMTIGTGSPEGVLTKPPGSLYWDTVAQAFWIKQTGTGSTGWVAVISN